MSYYAAGGYYSAGGFSLKKLVRAVGKAASFVQHQPILSSVISLVPGGSAALAGTGLVAGMAGSASAAHAVTSSTAGTPGHNAAVMQTTRRTGRKPRRHRIWVYD